jgi:hypothetical protein
MPLTQQHIYKQVFLGAFFMFFEAFYVAVSARKKDPRGYDLLHLLFRQSS